MTIEQKRFLIYAAIALITVVAVSQMLFLTVLKAYCFPARIWSIAFVWLVICTFNYWLMKTVSEKPNAVIRVFMLQFFVKLVLFTAYVAVGAMFFYEKQYVVAFILHFFVVYLFFAIFDVSLILKFVKEKSGQMSGSIEKSN